MRYSLLNVLRCQQCGGELTSVTHTESPCEMGKAILAPFDRVPEPGAVVGPAPGAAYATETGRLLRALAGHPGDADRNYTVVLERGVLVCGACERWYPVEGAIPELLPDHLRDWNRDLALLDVQAHRLPEPLAARMRACRFDGGSVSGGDRFKAAEIALPGKVENPGEFFGPGALSPFNPWNPDHSWHLVESFAAVRPLLGLEPRGLVLDMGSGYSWTTEWLFKSGYEAIGVDICRRYLEIGLRRIGAFRPHLLVADVENPPFATGFADAILGFEAFHHVPDRPGAMQRFAALLKPGRPIVLVEPGAAHEHAQVSIDVMAKFGILEKGMDLSDVEGYVAGLPFEPVVQHWCLRVADRELASIGEGAAGLRAHSVTPNNIYVIRRASAGAQGAVAPAAQVPSSPGERVRGFARRVLWPRVKRRAKAAAIRLRLE